MRDRNASTVEFTSDPTSRDLESGATLGAWIQPAESPQSSQRGRLSLIRALSVATMLPFARMEEELLRAPHHGTGVLAQSPYVAFIEHDEAYLVPVLGFTLGGPRIVVPKRVALSPEALRALGEGRTIMGPITVYLEE